MRVLFLGEGDLAGPARYLAAILTYAKIPFDHRSDQTRIPKSWRKPKRYDLIILSDYRYSSWTPCAKEWLIEEVTAGGTGLLMIGGWASFSGPVGGYAGTDIERLLPVRCVRGDDRVQKATGALLLLASPQPSPSGIGRSAATGEAFPLVCGYHRAIPKAGTQVSHVFRDVLYRKSRVSLGSPQPALVLGHAGRAKTAAFLTDCAPHWAGGLVDWGKRRITIKIAAHQTVEVGDHYLRFFRDLILSLAPESNRADI